MPSARRFENCRFIAWQDTLFVNGSRHYFKNCYIEGHVDFIFGTASAVFEDCTIHSKGQGYVTAHYRTEQRREYGLCFSALPFDRRKSGSGVYLGRPWRPYARVVFHRLLAGVAHQSRKAGTTGAILREKRLRGLVSTSRRDQARIRKRGWRGPGTCCCGSRRSFRVAQFFSRTVRGLNGESNQAVGTIAWADAQNKADEWYASAEASADCRQRRSLST